MRRHGIIGSGNFVNASNAVTGSHAGSANSDPDAKLQADIQKPQDSWKSHEDLLKPQTAKQRQAEMAAGIHYSNAKPPFDDWTGILGGYTTEKAIRDADDDPGSVQFEGKSIGLWYAKAEDCWLLEIPFREKNRYRGIVRAVATVHWAHGKVVDVDIESDQALRLAIERLNRTQRRRSARHRSDFEVQEINRGRFEKLQEWEVQRALKGSSMVAATDASQCPVRRLYLRYFGSRCSRSAKFSQQFL